MFLSLIKKIAILLGGAIYKVFPNFTKTFLKGHMSADSKNAFVRAMYKVLVYSISDEYYKNNTTTSRRMQLIDMVISDEAGVKWAEYYLSKSFGDDDVLKNRMFLWIDELLSTNSDIIDVHQVACSSGREVAYFSKKYKDRNFIGSDIDTAIISNCYKNWQIENLKFEVLRLENLNDLHKIDTDLVYASGSLQYLDYAILDMFFKEIFTSKCEYLLLAEPLHNDFDIFKERTSTKRGNFSWNHPYAYLLKNNGWILSDFYEEKSVNNANAKNIYIKAVKQ